MKKVIILSPSNGVGGVETFCHTLKSCLDKNGFDAEILAADRNKVPRFIRLVGLGAPWSGFLVGNLAKKRHYDFLVTNGLLGWNVTFGNILNIQHGTFAASAERIDRGVNFLKWFMKRFVWGYFEGKAAKRASFVVAVSEDTRNSVERYYKVKVNCVIENAVDLDLFKSVSKTEARKSLNLPIDKKIVLFVGRMEYAKGQDIIEKFMKGSVEKDVMFVLVLGNSWSSNKENVRVFSNVPNDKLPPFYSAADIFIFPSRHEGCAIAIIEAMSCGLPFVISEVGHALDIKKEKALGKYVIPLGNEPIFLKTVDEVMSLSGEELKKVSDAERNYVEKNNSLNEFCGSYIKIFI
ncbi:glycosyltransferase family 4 protein [Patescibacteria group bacterium]|nr:glycosyltransferase family 4 protein [Patescibacteria group bacterium]